MDIYMLHELDRFVSQYIYNVILTIYFFTY